MNSKDFFEAVRLLGAEKGVSEDALLEGIRKAIVTAVKADYANKDIVFCEIDAEKSNISVFVRKNVVDEVTDSVTQVSVDTAKRFNPNAVAGESVDIALETREVSRIAASKGKHILRQAIIEAEQNKIRAEFQNKEREVVTAKVIRVDPVSRDAVVEIGKITERLPRDEQLEKDNFKEGDLVKIYVSDIRESAKGIRGKITRRATDFVKKLIEAQVPETTDEVVKIMAVSREPGVRSKVAVASTDANVDPVGSCIGQDRSRINSVVEMLSGEKIDLIKYSEDPAEFVAAALAPSKVINVEILSQDERSCRVTVPNDQLSLAIGNSGLNARLAARLTGWKIDIRPETEEKVINFDE
ncbi:MAG: transcription termination factor NusA [Clostridiales bacterium]|nr:transcription termination factor NusA [Clostridiales bacterium]